MGPDMGPYLLPGSKLWALNLGCRPFMKDNNSTSTSTRIRTSNSNRTGNSSSSSKSNSNSNSTSNSNRNSNSIIANTIIDASSQNHTSAS